MLLVDGKPPKVEIIDERTIKYSWDTPNPNFIESQAQAAPLFLFRPAHYLKKFHAKYTSIDDIAKQGRGGQGTNWVQIYRRHDVMYNNDNPDLPSLNPWILKTHPPAQRFVFERNPFYYRIDQNGVQLPYLDKVIFTVAAANLVPAKAGLGEADLQPRYLGMRDYTFLRKSAKSSGVEVRLWQAGSGSQLALYPNLNAKDEVWRKLNQDVRFRRALSLGVDRDELNEVVYAGLAHPSANTIMPRSPLFKPEYATTWATYDPKQANKLLDDIGLTKQNDLGFRLLPDGRQATIIVEHSGEDTEQADALSLIADHWKKIGIKMLFKPQSAENFRLRVFSGEAIMTAYAGLTTAVPTADTNPKEFAPTMQGGLQWSRWGMYVESKGKQGEKCDLQDACQLLDLVHDWANVARRGRPPRGVGQDPPDQHGGGVHDRHGERHPAADRGQPQAAQRAEGRLLGLGSRRLHRPLQARHLLAVAVVLCWGRVTPVTRHAVLQQGRRATGVARPQRKKLHLRRGRLSERQHQAVGPVEERGGVDDVDDGIVVQPDFAQASMCSGPNEIGVSVSATEAATIAFQRLSRSTPVPSASSLSTSSVRLE